MDEIARNIANTLWWVLLVRGLAAIAFGILAVFWPGLTLVVLVYLFSAYIIATGLMNVTYGVFGSNRGDKLWMLSLIVGIVELGVGVYAIRNPLVSFVGLILIIGLTLIFRGVMEIAAAFVERRALDGAHKALLLIGGALAVVAGILVLRQPVVGGVAFVWVLGLYGLIIGAILIARAASLRSLLEHEEERRAQHGPRPI